MYRLVCRMKLVKKVTRTLHGKACKVCGTVTVFQPYNSTILIVIMIIRPQPHAHAHTNVSRNRHANGPVNGNDSVQREPAGAAARGPMWKEGRKGGRKEDFAKEVEARDVKKADPG